MTPALKSKFQGEGAGEMHLKRKVFPGTNGNLYNTYTAVEIPVCFIEFRETRADPRNIILTNSCFTRKYRWMFKCTYMNNGHLN